jgi:hypothetical protein
VKSASEVPTKSVSKASTVISAAPRVDLAFCMAVMTRVPSLQRPEISSCPSVSARNVAVRRYGRISISVSCVTVVAQGEKLIWLDRAVVDRLRAMRGAGESYSDAVLRLVKLEGSRAS